jgi:hypothetical protein
MRKRFKIVNAGFLFFGILLGFSTMILAPGFGNRANNSVGFPSSFGDFIFRFLKAITSFSVDALTHPGAYFAFVVGIGFVTSFKGAINFEKFRQSYKKLCISFLLLLTSLMGGGTLAYTSWHQALGVDLLLVPVFFGAGVLTSSHLPLKIRQNISIFLIIMAILTSFNSLRAAYLINERAMIWDAKLTQNICLLRKDPDSLLVGAEIRYPPLGLGIEDIQTWDWMRAGYVSWVQNLTEFGSVNCG